MQLIYTSFSEKARKIKTAKKDGKKEQMFENFACFF
jgi:hypothetical protein